MANEAENLAPGQYEDRLDGWQEIASFFGRGVRTIQRWEQEETLPIHRLVTGRRSLVYAYRDELKRWVGERETHPFVCSNPVSELLPRGDAFFRTPRDVMPGWKEIAAALGISVNTAQRWEKRENLPVRRLKSNGRGIPFVLRSELLAWLEKSGTSARSPSEGMVRTHPPPVLLAFLNASSASFAVLDDKGTVVAINRAWREFGASHGNQHPRFSLGKNYLELCTSPPWGGVIDPASTIAQGIRAVLDGTRMEFRADYICDCPRTKGRFSLRLTRFGFQGIVRVIAMQEEVPDLLVG